MVRAVLVQEIEIAQDERTDIDGSSVIVLYYDAVKLSDKLYLSNAQLSYHLEYEPQCQYPFFLGLAKLDFQAKTYPILLLKP